MKSKKIINSAQGISIMILIQVDPIGVYSRKKYLVLCSCVMLHCKISSSVFYIHRTLCCGKWFAAIGLITANF